MKTTVKTISEETKRAIGIYLSLNEKFKGAYFFTPPSNAGSRRGYERHNSFEYDGDGIVLKFKVECSCRNVYVRKNIEIDGIKKNAASLKKYV